MDTITSLTRQMNIELRKLPHYVEWNDYVSTEQGGKIILGRHVTISFKVCRPPADEQAEALRIIKMFFARSARRCRLEQSYSFRTGARSSLILTY